MERQLYAPAGYAKVIALSDRVKEEVHTHYDVPDEDVVVQPYGYDPAQFSVARRGELRERARAELGYGDEDRVVVFVANELERKGFDTLVAAIARLGDPSVRLLVVGRVDPGEYAALIAQHRLEDRVRFAGSSDDVAFHHAASDCFALPTRYEPWGLVIVEALASGLPVVTTEVAGAALAVRDGETGRLLRDPDDADECAVALRWALSDEAPAPATVGESVAWLRWERVIGDYLEILRRAFGA
jgi:UDP-glucose:(heptosyl)LPS alpha-1,3-glucosyltransferase